MCKRNGKRSVYGDGFFVYGVDENELLYVFEREG